MYHLLRFKNKQRSGFITFCLLIISLSSAAQLRDAINLPDNDDKSYHIGIVVMGVSSRFQISQHPQFLQNDTVLGVYPENTGGIGQHAYPDLRLRIIETPGQRAAAEITHGHDITGDGRALYALDLGGVDPQMPAQQTMGVVAIEDDGGDVWCGRNSSHGRASTWAATCARRV